jgi:hypothetical protein
MKINKLNKELDEALIKYIKDEGFVASGSLVKSIKFKCKYDKNLMDLKMEFEANDYIKYLDDGKLIDKFLETKECLSLIEEFMAVKIQEFFTDSL